MITCAVIVTNGAYAQQFTKNNKEGIMTSNAQQEVQRRVAQSYYEKINNGDFNDDSYYGLFTEDVKVFYPKFGFAEGKAGVKKFGQQVRKLFGNFGFELEKFNFIVTDNVVVVEGAEKGTIQTGVAFPDDEVSYGKFCTVFEFEGNRIKRMYCYVDPDHAGQDKKVVALLKTDDEQDGGSLQERQRKNAEAYFRKVDAGEFDSGYYNLFTEDVELYFPKFGFGKGKEGLRKFGDAMSGFLRGLTHDIEHFNYVVSNDIVVVEGTEKGITIDGKAWPDHVTAFGKFCNVFEFEGDLIKRVHIYVDPDVTSEDAVRMARLNPDPDGKGVGVIEQTTRATVAEFYRIQSGKKDGSMAALFADTVDFDLPGNEEKFPWVGKRHSKKEVEDYFKILYQHIKSEKFDVEFIAVNGENAVAVGRLSSVILKYDKVFNAQFINIFKVHNGKIVKYHFIEDSYRLNEEMK